MKEKMYNNYQQLLYDGIFGDTWNRFVKHPEYERWSAYVMLLEDPSNTNKDGCEIMIKTLGEMILKDIGAIK